MLEKQFKSFIFFGEFRKGTVNCKPFSGRAL